jgi:mono/diheme cytochrome c family protein
MSTRILPALAIVLWLATIAVAVFFFVRGQTRVAPDGRTAILLAPEERDLVLTEMRAMLVTVQGMVDGVKAENVKQVVQAARASGMAAAADVNPALMAKLPLEFKQLGLGLHKRFDEIAAEADSNASREHILESLSAQLSACVACHASYRIETVAPVAK